VVFDVDGTLCDTFAVDDECFCATASQILGIHLDASSWQGAPNITDSGILGWLWQRNLRRAPSSGEIEGFLATFEAALALQLQRAPEFRAITGAARLLAHLEKVWVGVRHGNRRLAQNGPPQASGRWPAE
jgi:beta-phosphoglucomutase-like phosphatase (HAD superfamily)